MSDVIDGRCYPVLSGAMGAAVKGAFGFYPMANDLAPTVLAYRRQLVNRALEAVERMGVTGGDHLEREIVVVAADFTSSHWNPPHSGSTMLPT
jgi:hypothetical protein